jgi:glycosyltransferase involved in cell wall biosynthesis
MAGQRVTGDVTVVIPTILGREDLLDRALASVRAQTVQPAKVIVVCDRDRKGAWWARNQGAAQVETTWLAWLDDDDELLPNHLEALLKGAEETGADLVYSYPEFPDSRDPLAVAHNGAWVCPLGVPFGPEQERHLRYAGNFIPVTYLVRVGLVRAVGGMPPSGGRNLEEDYQLLLRLLNFGARFSHVPERTWVYHVHDANTGGGYRGTGASNKEAFSER